MGGGDRLENNLGQAYLFPLTEIKVRPSFEKFKHSLGYVE